MLSARRVMLAALSLVTLLRPVAAAELLPRHMTAAAQKSIRTGLDALAAAQGPDGNFPGSPDGNTYAVSMTALAGMAFLANGNTPTRGPYAENIRRCAAFVMSHARDSGLICSDPEFNGRSMYSHGFSVLFLSSIYGMETDDRRRTAMKKVIESGIKLTSGAQSNLGGWTYVPGGGDEGSVTVTQMQALRAASNAGFTVPKGTVDAAIKYLEMCQTPEGGIQYSYGSASGPLVAISAAALATMYNAGDYDSKMADACLKYVNEQLVRSRVGFGGGGHSFYTNLYASQALYQAGDEYWSAFYPGVRDQLVRSQTESGQWDGDGVGPVYGTSIALIVLQLPYKFLPIYQR